MRTTSTTKYRLISDRARFSNINYPFSKTHKEISMRRTSHDAMVTRGLIIEAAQETFYKRGVSNASLEEIAETAGVTRGAIYWHFGDRDGLLRETFDCPLLPFSEILQAASSQNVEDPLGLLLESCITCLEQATTEIRRRRALEICLFKCESGKHNRALHDRLAESRSSVEAAIRFLLCAAVAKNQLPIDLNIELATRLVHLLAFGVLQNLLMEVDTLPITSKPRMLITALSMALTSQALRHSPSAYAHF
jgi:TetR/AcrR family transcriptional regulator, acrAB operon repressor